MHECFPITTFRFVSLGGKDAFKGYGLASNNAAVLPAILPAVVLTLVTFLLLFIRPGFVSKEIVLLSLALNSINLASSFTWQARLHAQLARVGYDEGLIKRLIKTNWIRTIALFLQGLVAVYCVTSAMH